MITADEVIKILNLKPLPIEGGMYNDVYYTEQMLEGDRPLCSVIYYLLSGDAFSHMHRLPTDEVYYFFLGDPVELLELMPDGQCHSVTLGQDIKNGECVQHVVKAGTWQGSHLKKQDGEYGFALMGTSMAPSYMPEDYEQGDRETLCRQFPEAAALINKLTTEGKL